MDYSDIQVEIVIYGFSPEGDSFEEKFIFVRPEKIKELKKDKGIIGDILRRLE